MSHDTVHHKFFDGLSQSRQVLCCKFRGTNVQLDFQNNSAVNGGDEVYGTYLYQDCIASTEHVTILNKIQNLFKLDNSINTSLSAISSNPLHVCICDSRGQPPYARLDFIYLNVTLFSGERFTVPLVVVGEEFGTVAGTVHATLLDRTSGSLGRGQNAQRTAVGQYILAEYSVHSSGQSEIIILSAFSGTPFAVDQRIISKNVLLLRERRLTEKSIYEHEQMNYINGQLLNTPVSITVALEKCPLAFELIGDPPSCQCHQELVENNIKHCVMMNHTGYIHRSGTMWVNATFSDTGNNTLLIVHKYKCQAKCSKQVGRISSPRRTAGY